MTQNPLTPDDKIRTKTQAQRVFELMTNEPGWYTLPLLADELQISEAGASARLRDFRKPEWGGHQVDKRRTEAGSLWWYRLIPNGPLLDGKRNAPTAKMEARERVTAYLDARSHSFFPAEHSNTIVAYDSKPLLTTDLRELLK